MRFRFKSLLTIIFILIIACISIGVGYTFYDKVINNETVVVVDGDITVNYLNGNEFRTSDNVKLEFSVTNNSSEQSYYYIQISDVKGNTNEITYEIKSDTNNLDISNNLKSEIISNYIMIEGNKTDNYTIEIKGDNKETYSGKIVVGLKQNENNTFADTIISNNSINETPISTLGTNSTLSEGLIKSTDDLGITYYFRGNIANNYVSFAGNTWRIVKINGDGSVKLVLDGISQVLSKYYEGEAYEFSSSIIYESLNTWYDANLKLYSDYIASYKYCNDYVYDEENASFEAYKRIVINKIPTFVCLGISENEKIGLLTADEVMLAGGSTENNSSYYLYNSNIKTEYFTMTSAKIATKYNPFVVTVDGALKYDTDGTLLRGVRPVVNIIKNATVTGSGKIDDPYKINTDIS